MLNKIKLKLYNNKIIGYAYETYKNNIFKNKTSIQTYLIVNDNDRTNIIKYNYFLINNNELEYFIYKLNGLNYHPLSNWNSDIDDIKILKKKKLS